MIKEYRYTFEELNITSNDITELLGFEDGVIPEPFPELIEMALNEAPRHCSVKAGTKTFANIKINTSNNTIQINDLQFSPSKVVVNQFKKAVTLVLFVCTAGKTISEYSKKIANDGDPILSYIFDVIGSVTVEKAMDKVQSEIETEMKGMRLGISDRFSPGYCEWSVDEQQKLFSLLPFGFCGVELSTSSLMNPIKSVSGIIAVGEGLHPKGYQCNWCNDKSCIYGKIKRQKKI
jgi:hypothetical protein